MADKSPEVSVHHAALSVGDMQRSIDFYNRHFGFEVDSRAVGDDGKLEIVHLRRDDNYIELFCHAEARPLPESAKTLDGDLRQVGTKHFAFHTDDAYGLHERLENDGVEVLMDVQTNNPTYYYFFFRDPDDILVEIISRRPDAPPAPG